jgi:hypothetical protein
MEVLSQCTAPGSYSFRGVTRKQDHVRIHDADELYAAVPVGAAALEGKLAKAGELNVDMTIVGAYESDASSVRAADLQGECDRATHVIRSLTVGAFSFFAGAEAEVGGGGKVAGAGVGAQTSSKREILNEDGSTEACTKSDSSAKLPPKDCGALLRVEVIPILRPATTDAAAQAVAPAPAGPAAARPKSKGPREILDEVGGEENITMTGANGIKDVLRTVDDDAKTIATELGHPVPDTGAIKVRAYDLQAQLVRGGSDLRRLAELAAMLEPTGAWSGAGPREEEDRKELTQKLRDDACAVTDIARKAYDRGAPALARARRHLEQNGIRWEYAEIAKVAPLPASACPRKR